MPVHDYTQLTRFLVALTVFLLVLVCATGFYVLFARRFSRVTAVERLARHQNIAITAVIAEIETSDLYGGFPHSLMDTLMRRRSEFDKVILGKVTDETD